VLRKIPKRCQARSARSLPTGMLPGGRRPGGGFVSGGRGCRIPPCQHSGRVTEARHSPRLALWQRVWCALGRSVHRSRQDSPAARRCRHRPSTPAK